MRRPTIRRTLQVDQLRHSTPPSYYFARRLAEGKTKNEITHWLKRYIAREIYRAIREFGPQTPTIAPT
jgi:transposase